jgi:hypothetical protein
MKTISTRNLPIKSYSDADAYLGSKAYRKLCGNTYVERINSLTIGVRYQATIVVYYHSDGSITLDSGCWRTVTTKSRMNNLLPDGYRVSQKNFDWFVRTPKGDLAFEDGIRLEVGQ